MKNFEYKVIIIPTYIPWTRKRMENVALEFEAKLNALGADGWELVQWKEGFFFFKREAESISEGEC